MCLLLTVKFNKLQQSSSQDEVSSSAMSLWKFNSWLLIWHEFHRKGNWTITIYLLGSWALPPVSSQECRIQTTKKKQESYQIVEVSSAFAGYLCSNAMANALSNIKSWLPRLLIATFAPFLASHDGKSPIKWMKLWLAPWLDRSWHLATPWCFMSLHQTPCCCCYYYYSYSYHYY